MLVQVLELPQRAAKLLYTTILRLYASFGESNNRLNAALADQLIALEELELVEDALRKARGKFDEGIERMYIRGGTARVAVVMFFDEIDSVGRARGTSMSRVDDRVMPAFMAELYAGRERSPLPLVSYRNI